MSKKHWDAIYETRIRDATELPSNIVHYISLMDNLGLTVVAWECSTAVFGRSLIHTRCMVSVPMVGTMWDVIVSGISNSRKMK